MESCSELTKKNMFLLPQWESNIVPKLLRTGVWPLGQAGLAFTRITCVYLVHIYEFKGFFRNCSILLVFSCTQYSRRHRPPQFLSKNTAAGLPKNHFLWDWCTSEAPETFELELLTRIIQLCGDSSFFECFRLFLRLTPQTTKWRLGHRTNGCGSTRFLCTWSWICCSPLGLAANYVCVSCVINRANCWLMGTCFSSSKQANWSM